MAQEVIVNVQANTDNAVKSIQGINKELSKAQTTSDDLSNSLDDVSVSGDKAASSLEDVAGNGGAMAILDSLTGGLATRLRDAYEATRLFNTSLKGTKTALIATGIGAVAVLLGTIVTYWDEITEFITGATGALDDHIKANQKNITQLDHQIGLLEAQKGILEANGDNTTRINKKIEEAVLLRQEENRILTENLKIQLEQEKAQIKEVGFLEQAEIQLYNILGLKELAAKATAESLIGTQEERDALEEINLKIRESEAKQLEFELKLATLRKAEKDKAAEEELKRREQGLEGVGFNLETATKELDDRQQILDAKLKLEGKYTEGLKGYANVREQLIEAETELRKNQVNETIGVLGNLQAVVGQQTVAGKALGIATAVINTYQGASEALKQKSTLPSPFDVVAKVANVAAVIATGLQTVKSIASVNVPQVRGASGGGGGAVPSAPSITAPAQAPSFNIVGGGATNQLAGLLAEQESQPVRAYVVSNEVSTAQSLDRNIVESATLG